MRTLNDGAWRIWLRINGCPRPTITLFELRARLKSEEYNRSVSGQAASAGADGPTPAMPPHGDG